MCLFPDALSTLPEHLLISIISPLEIKEKLQVSAVSRRFHSLLSCSRAVWGDSLYLESVLGQLFLNGQALSFENFEEGLGKLLQHVKLRKLMIFSDFGFEERVIEVLEEEILSREDVILRQLVLEADTSRDFYLTLLDKFQTSLLSLTLCFLDPAGPIVWEFVQKCTFLKEFTFKNQLLAIFDRTAEKTLIDALRDKPLRSLELQGIENLKAEGFAELCNGQKKLESISFSHCKNLNVKSFTPLLESVSRMQISNLDLDLTMDHDVDRLLFEIPALFPNLASLSLFRNFDRFEAEETAILIDAFLNAKMRATVTLATDDEQEIVRIMLKDEKCDIVNNEIVEGYACVCFYRAQRCVQLFLTE